MLSSMLTRPLPPFLYFDTLCLGCKAFFFVIALLVPWKVYEVLPFFYFKDGFEYIKRCTAQTLIPWVDFFTNRGFKKFSPSHVILIFDFYFYLHLFDGVRFHNSQELVSFLFLEISDFFLDLVNLLFLLFIFFRFSLLAWHIFLCQIQYLYLNWISSPSVLGYPIYFYFLANSLISPMYIRQLIFP